MYWQSKRKRERRSTILVQLEGHQASTPRQGQAHVEVNKGRKEKADCKQKEASNRWQQVKAAIDDDGCKT